MINTILHQLLNIIPTVQENLYFNKKVLHTHIYFNRVLHTHIFKDSDLKANLNNYEGLTNPMEHI
jgi:hypothetical protein